MTTNMTERDKKLLYMLGYIVIIFSFVIIAIRPTFRRIRETNKQIETEQATHDMIEQKISRKALVNEYKDKIQEKVDLYATRYYPKMESTKVDELLTGYVLSRGLKAVNLFIDMPNDPISLPPYQFSEEAARQAEQEVSGTEVGTPDEAQIEAFTQGLASGSVDLEQNSNLVTDTALSGVYAASVNLTAYGKESQLKDLMDQLFKDQSLRVISYGYSTVDSLGFSYVDGQLVELTENDRQLDVNLQVLMYDADAYVEPEISQEQEAEE
ncbi:MAG: hypothetical protein K6E84_08110 [Lachnospiraceae bacterium]|nr:hypothetical protein [Lachnospiraceae bacterium]